MEKNNLITIEVTEGEYGTILEMLHFLTKNYENDIFELRAFAKLESYLSLKRIQNRFKDNKDRLLVFNDSEISHFLKEINEYSDTIVEKDTYNELKSVTNKILDSIKAVLMF